MPVTPLPTRQHVRDGLLEVRLLHPPEVAADVVAGAVEVLRERLAQVPRTWVTIARGSGWPHDDPEDPRSLYVTASGDMAALGELARRAVSFPYAGGVDVSVVEMPCS